MSCRDFNAHGDRPSGYTVGALWAACFTSIRRLHLDKAPGGGEYRAHLGSGCEVSGRGQRRAKQSARPPSVTPAQSHRQESPCPSLRGCPLHWMLLRWASWHIWSFWGYPSGWRAPLWASLPGTAGPCPALPVTGTDLAEASGDEDPVFPENPGEA